MIDLATMNKINELPSLATKQPFKGAFATQPIGCKAAVPIKFSLPGSSKLLDSIEAAVRACGLQNGMTISFHHSLRNGDAVMRMVVNILAQMGFKDLTLSASSISAVQDEILPHIEAGVITAIDTSGARGKIGRFIQSGKMAKPAIFRTHGGRARAIESGELHIDVAFIAAPSCDRFGNINGVQGKSACGSLGYAMVDAAYADKVVAVTDGYQEEALGYVSIPQSQVDYIVQVDSIGDPAGIATGSIRVSNNPAELVISKYAAAVIEHSGYFKNGMSFQFGSGGIAISTAKFIQDKMQARGIVAASGVGGATGFLVEMLRDGYIKTFYDPQDFDLTAIESLASNSRHLEISASDYANPFSANPAVNMLDVAVLSATEVDLNFNVNVLTDSYGRLMGAPGGHPDASAGAKLTIIAMPLLRGRLPMLVDRVQTIVTPGESVDVLVTDYGIAINPKRSDIIAVLQGKGLPLFSVDELYKKAESLAGKPQLTTLGDKICGVVEYRDGTIIDVIWSLAE